MGNKNYSVLESRLISASLISCSQLNLFISKNALRNKACETLETTTDLSVRKVGAMDSPSYCCL